MLKNNNNNKIVSIIYTAILIVSAFTVALNIQHVKAQEANNSTLAAINATNTSSNITLGNLIYEGKGEISSQTVLEGPTVQTSFSSNGTIRLGANSENVTEIGTYTTTPRANGILYGEGKGVMTGRNNEMVTWTSQELGIMNPDGKIVFHGSIFFNTLSPVGNLAFLDNTAGVFTFEVDASKNTLNRVWELR